MARMSSAFFNERNNLRHKQSLILNSLDNISCAGDDQMAGFKMVGTLSSQNLKFFQQNLQRIQLELESAIAPLSACIHSEDLDIGNAD